MKLLKYIIPFAAVAGMLSACTSDLDTVQTVSIENAVAPTIHAFSEPIVVTADNQEDIVLISWDAADFGAKTQINYSILASYQETTLTLFNGISETSYSTTKGALNQRFYNDLGLPVEEAVTVEFFIGATVGVGYETIYSNRTQVEFTATLAEKQYPVIYVIGDFCGWVFDTAPNLYNFTEDETTYEGFIDFGGKAANGFKLTGVAAWDDSCNWGTGDDTPAEEASSVQLITSGGSGNLTCYSKRFYKFSFNTSTLLLEKLYSFDQLGISGDCTGWGAEDVVMDFNSAKRRFWADVENLSGEFKFRADGDWATNWGVGEGENALAVNGGNIIVAEAGNYRVYAYLSNSNELYYELDAKMYGQEESAVVETPEVPEEPEVESGGKYIYLNNNDGWEATYLYTWCDDGTSTGLTGTWPGKEMTGKVTIAGTEYVYYEMPASTDGLTINMIFNNNAGTQTANLEGYTLDRNLYFTMTGKEVTEQFVEEVSFKLYAHSDAEWPQMYLWMWDDDNNNYSGGTWPGVEMTETETVDGVDYFVYELPTTLTGKTLNFIFSYGSSQTQNLEGYLIDRNLYFTIDETNHGALVGADDPDIWSICGTINNWQDTNMTETDGEWVVTDVTLVTTDEFKFRLNGAWTSQFGVVDGDYPYAPSEKIFLATGSNPDSIKVSENGTYDIYFYPDEAVAYIMPLGERPTR